MNIIIQGILLGLSTSAPVGPTNVEVIRRGLKEGWKSSAVFCLGVLVALVIYLVLLFFGLSVLIKSEIFSLSITFFGVVVLLYLAYIAIKDFFEDKEIDLSGGVSKNNKNFISGIVLTIFNPAVLLLWTSILGAGLANKSFSWFYGFMLSSGIFIGETLFFVFLVLLVYGGKKYINRNNFKYISLLAGLVLMCFAIKFGYSFITMVMI